MELKTLVQKSRSYRRFDGSVVIDGECLRELIQLAQYSPTMNNLQPLKFWLSNSADMNALIFPTLGWAGALKSWTGPGEDERPSAYIIILGDTSIKENFRVDYGIAAQSIMLGAAEKGLGGCMMGSVRKEDLRKALGIPDKFTILLVLALGKPAETVVTEFAGEGHGVAYYRDENDAHHVPKRRLAELIVHDIP